MNTRNTVQPYTFGLFAVIALLVFYFGILMLVSGWDFALTQFIRYWYFVVPLAIGFGIQVGLFSSLRQKHEKMSAGMIATTGATSTLSMVSCCAHYLVNLLPILGITGIVTLISTYQIQLFWVGLVFNFAGIIYMASKVFRFRMA